MWRAGQDGEGDGICAGEFGVNRKIPSEADGIRAGGEASRFGGVSVL